MIQAVGHRVKRLVRVRIGDLTLDNLKPGKFRFLDKSERDALMALSEKKSGRKK